TRQDRGGRARRPCREAAQERADVPLTAELTFSRMSTIPFSMPGLDQLKPPVVRELVPLWTQPKPASISIRPARRHPCLSPRKAEPRYPARRATLLEHR